MEPAQTTPSVGRLQQLTEYLSSTDSTQMEYNTKQPSNQQMVLLSESQDCDLRLNKPYASSLNLSTGNNDEK